MAGLVTRSASRIDLAKVKTVRSWKVYLQAGALHRHHEEELRVIRFDRCSKRNLLGVAHGAAMHFGMPRDTDCRLMTSQNVTSNQAVEFLLRGVK